MVRALAWATALAGIVLIWVMAKIYMVPARPLWDHWLTAAGFLLTTLLLGAVAGAACDTPGRGGVLGRRGAGGGAGGGAGIGSSPFCRRRFFPSHDRKLEKSQKRMTNNQTTSPASITLVPQVRDQAPGSTPSGPLAWPLPEIESRIPVSAWMLRIR